MNEDERYDPLTVPDDVNEEPIDEEPTQDIIGDIPIILDRVKAILTSREKGAYGNVYHSFLRITDYWNAYLSHVGILEKDSELKPKDVAMLMVLFKMSREEHKHKDDNILDMIGYATLAKSIQEVDDYVDGTDKE